MTSKRILNFEINYNLMLCNLEELQTNLTALIHELSQIHNKLVNPIQAKKMNLHSLLLKIPKIILLIKICPYLDVKQVVNLSTTCGAMRKIVYSPIGWKMLNHIHTPYSILLREIILFNEKESLQTQFNQKEQFQVHMIQDQRTLKKARLECKKSLMQTFQAFKMKEEENTQLKRKLKIQKSFALKRKNYRICIQDRKTKLRQQNNDFKTLLRTLSEDFDQKIQDLDTINIELTKERDKLQNQKTALVAKVREYQFQIEILKTDSQRSKQILKKIKQYLLCKQL